MRIFTDDQEKLLRAPDTRVNLMATFFLDEGTYRFCDDVIDLSDGTHNYLAASALLSSSDIRSGDSFAAEGTTLICDGNRMAQYGIQDPARVLSDILAYLFQQRRVDIILGFRWPTERNISLSIPLYGGKINNAKLVDAAYSFDSIVSGGDSGGDSIGESASGVNTQLIIQLDSLAMRYQRSSNRTRSHNDQIRIDPTDMYYSYVEDAQYNERNIYWGKKTPNGTSGSNTFYGLGGPQYDS